ncbi:DUF6745 domain-containing protein [Pantanalinema sp. GBBB05]|uniref:DUF6745 domain-containing protein n=1 Tax=Pantanalinema sp. GBBB05 TaxID=2604139 RepID=UPI001DE0E84F|nr:hypothetical protein [Pantanalinema sp. GBBB05]
MDSTDRQQLLQSLVQKWRDRLSHPLDQNQATSAILALYDYTEQRPPDLVWVDSPLAALPFVQQAYAERDSLVLELWQGLREDLWKPLKASLGNLLEELNRTIGTPFITQFCRSFLWLVQESLPEAGVEPLNNCLLPEWGMGWAAVFEAASQLGIKLDDDRYALFCNYFRAVGWMFPFEEQAIVCQRPQIHWDESGQIHALAMPAIYYPDGFSVYAYHGIHLPQKYGQYHPQQWQSTWLLEEENAELRRVLIQEIGYGRICQELQAIALDTWQEYSLLRLASDVDVEPVHLLKMTCPSTGFIHILRVPPDLDSAREAIRWVNWGVDPTEFSAQT